MKELSYPYDGQKLLRKKKKYKREILEKIENSNLSCIKIKIAILCGSTVNDIVDILELFLLNEYIIPEFYIGNYDKYYEDIMFDDSSLKEFAPDIIYIHTTYRNIKYHSSINKSENRIENDLQNEFKVYESMWEKIFSDYNAIIIQNNFEKPPYQYLGNADISSYGGLHHYIHHLNNLFYQYVRDNKNIYINDIDYISSYVGLSNWHSFKYWSEYKYAMNLLYIPNVSYSIFSIIKSIYGKNYKGIVVDADNTLWGGIVGEDGADNLLISPDTSIGYSFYDWQIYLKELTKRGILVGIVSKNNKTDLLDGISNADNIMERDDFVDIIGNWESKDRNIKNMIAGLDLSPNQFLYVDDSSFEREQVYQSSVDIQVIDADNPVDFLRYLNEGRFFELTNLSDEDRQRTKQYKSRKLILDEQKEYINYIAFLKNLTMKANIKVFSGENQERIIQLINKTNQFNLTTRRYSSEKVDYWLSDESILLYASLEDKFAEHGIVAISIVDFMKEKAHIDVFLMSCRVLKRNLEYALMDEIIKVCNLKGIKTITAEYIKTAKNIQVKNLYENFGFICVKSEKNEKNEEVYKEYELEVDNYSDLNTVIEIVI